MSLVISKPKVTEEDNFLELHIMEKQWEGYKEHFQCTEVVICSLDLSLKAIYGVQEFIFCVLEVVDVGH